MTAPPGVPMMPAPSRGDSVGRQSAVETAQAALERIAALNPALNCFTAVLPGIRRSPTPSEMDRRIAAGEDPGPFAGVPFAVKNLFDIRGLATLAGSKIHAEKAPAARDAAAVERLKQAGAVLVGALNMDEYAYGFTTENTHYGPTRNPHDLQPRGRWFLRRFGGGRGGRPGAADA